MIFGNQLRSNKTTVVLVAAIVFLTAFIGLVYNHLDAWQLHSPSVTVDDSGAPSVPAEQKDQHPPRPPPPSPPPPIQTGADADIRDFYFKELHKPSVKPDTKSYRPWGAFEHKLPDKILWDKPLGENLCIIDLDNRPWDEPGQLFGPNLMSWDRPNEVHGLSLGILNHWIYAKIHGYKYYFIEIDTPEDRRASWKKPPIMTEILKKHDACIYLDSDAVFHNLDLPFEWLMNYWGIHPDTNSMALAADPKAKNNEDKFGKVYLNTGFIIAQNNDKTYEIMKAWEDCPEEGGKHPDCVLFRTNRPGKPTDQGGFGTYIRYDYEDSVKELSCDEANGFPESHSGCNGKFIRHLWTGKHDWIVIEVGQQFPGPYLEMFHHEWLNERESFYLTEPQLFALGDQPREEK